MNSFLIPHNGPSLTGVIDVTAHSISWFQENAPPKNIEDIFIPKSDSSIALPYDVIIDELGNNVISMYQFIGDINDEKVAGLESLLNYMSENVFTKDGPAINEGNVINNNGNVLNVEGYSYKTYVSNNYKSHIGHVENNLYKEQGNRTFNNTGNMYKHINQYSTDVFNSFKISKTHIVKKHIVILITMFLLIKVTPLTLMVHTI